MSWNEGTTKYTKYSKKNSLRERNGGMSLGLSLGTNVTGAWPDAWSDD
jgi:hypothetical protein